ncbi:MAG: zinc-ribbon domain-containing protein [Promethearchaeota archaeon]
MAKFCPYCGKQVKENDKFCVYCGKPLLSSTSKEKKVEKQVKKEIPKEELVNEEQQEEIEAETKEEREEEKEKELIKKKKEKKKKKKEKKIKREPKPLPEDVKEQINLYIQLSEINSKKKVLADKLKDLSKMAKSEEYEYDESYQEKINVQLEAVKKLTQELKEQENELKQKMEGEFIVKKLNEGIRTKEFQLKNLTREFKLHKIDKETFTKLRDKYKQEREKLMEERDELNEGINMWIQEIEMEKSEVSSMKKLNKGRYSAKEIDEEEFKEKDEKYTKKIKNLEEKIGVLKELMK